MRILSLLILFVASSTLFAGNITVSGYAKSFYNNNVSVFKFSDYITYTKKELATTIIDSNGYFTTSFNVENTIEAYVSIDNFQALLYLEPNNEYEIIFPHRDSIQGPAESYLPENPRPIDIIIEQTKPKNDLNYYISEFNDDWTEFTEENFKLIIKKRDKALIDKFKSDIKTKYGNINSKYLQTIIKYRIVSLEQLAGLTSGLSILKNHYNTDFVHSLNNEYMHVYKTTLGDYFSSEILNNDMILNNHVNVNPNYDSIINYFKRDPNLTNEELTELIVLQGLFSIFYNKGNKKDSILLILDQAKNKCKFAENKTLAINTYNRLMKLLPGTDAPAFSLKDKEDYLVKLEDFKGRYVYMTFWNSKDEFSVQNILSIPSLKEKYGNKIDFIAICTDKDPDYMKNFITENKLDFFVLHSSDNKKILSDYDVYSYPTSIFIDKEGKIIQAPAENLSNMDEVDVIFFNAFQKDNQY